MLYPATQGEFHLGWHLVLQTAGARSMHQHGGNVLQDAHVGNPGGSIPPQVLRGRDKVSGRQDRARQLAATLTRKWANAFFEEEAGKLGAQAAEQWHSPSSLSPLPPSLSGQLTPVAWASAPSPCQQALPSPALRLAPAVPSLSGLAAFFPAHGLSRQLGSWVYF